MQIMVRNPRKCLQRDTIVIMVIWGKLSNVTLFWLICFHFKIEVDFSWLYRWFGFREFFASSYFVFASVRRAKVYGVESFRKTSKSQCIHFELMRTCVHVCVSEHEPNDKLTDYTIDYCQTYAWRMVLYSIWWVLWFRYAILPIKTIWFLVNDTVFLSLIRSNFSDGITMYSH